MVTEMKTKFDFSHLRDLFIAETSVSKNKCVPYAQSAFAKKWVGNVGAGSIESLENRATLKFLSSNDKCETFNLLGTSRFERNEVMVRAREFLTRLFQPIYDGRRHDIADSSIAWLLRDGPGASHGVEGETFLDKNAVGALTTTSSKMHDYYYGLISGTPLELVEIERSVRHPVRVVKGSKLAFAPKSADEVRALATEPSLNMKLQLAIGEVITDRLRRIGIDLATQQEKNRELARRGSVDGSLATIDLSSASDSVSLKLVQWLLGGCQGLLWYLSTFRSPQMVLPKCGSSVYLHMVSTMGNGFTFPLETAIFLAICVGVARTKGVSICWKGRDINFGVFGDDIIVPEALYEDVVTSLIFAGFTPNMDKCHHGADPFRESCGADWHRGYNVRGVYLRSLTDDGETYSAINRLNVWSTKHGIPIPRTIRYLMSNLEGDVLYVPMYEGDDAGFRIQLRDIPATYKFPRPSTTMLIKLGASPRYPAGIIYRKLMAHPVKERVISRDGELRLRYRLHPCGCERAFIAGFIRGDTLTRRSFRVKRRVAMDVSVGWDTPRDEHIDSLRYVGAINNFRLNCCLN